MMLRINAVGRISPEMHRLRDGISSVLNRGKFVDWAKLTPLLVARKMVPPDCPTVAQSNAVHQDERVTPRCRSLERSHAQVLRRLSALEPRQRAAGAMVIIVRASNSWLTFNSGRARYEPGTTARCQTKSDPVRKIDRQESWSSGSPAKIIAMSRRACRASVEVAPPLVAG